MNKLTLLCYFLLCGVFPIAAQTLHPLPAADGNSAQPSQPRVSELLIAPDIVSDLHLKPNFATTILMPEPVANVVLGAPTLFDEEHSEHAPELVVVKPVTDHAATSDLFIATRSGQHVSLKLISDGDAAASQPVDYLLVYKRPREFLIPSDDPSDAFLADTPANTRPRSIFETAFEDQQHIASPTWTVQHDPKLPSKIAASIGSVSADGNSAVVAFSVLNQSEQWIEILPPQIELNNAAAQPGKKAKKKQQSVLADQVPITDYRYTQTKLAPGARADGVVRFERPNFKQAQERLQLELATADAVNRPLLLNLPFTAAAGSPQQAAAELQEDGDARQ
jgi:hypothetical protein